MKVALVGEPADQRSLYDGIETSSRTPRRCGRLSRDRKDLAAALPGARKRLGADGTPVDRVSQAKKLGTDLNRDSLWKAESRRASGRPPRLARRHLVCH